MLVFWGVSISAFALARPSSSQRSWRGHKSWEHCLGSPTWSGHGGRGSEAPILGVKDWPWPWKWGLVKSFVFFFWKKRWPKPVEEKCCGKNDETLFCSFLGWGIASKLTQKDWWVTILLLGFGAKNHWEKHLSFAEPFRHGHSTGVLYLGCSETLGCQSSAGWHD